MYQIILESEYPVQIINRDCHDNPFVISIPHSGVKIPRAMVRDLKHGTLLANMDWYVPELYGFLKDMGFTILVNQVSRYVIDPNRDPALGCQNDYARSLIYQKTTFGKEMYEHPLTNTEAATRMRKFYQVYHNVLHALIAKKLQHFDKIYLLDLHSFGQEVGADIVLGNNYGESMDNRLVYALKKSFEANHLSAAVNDPFRGGYITRHYGKKGSRSEALQIEISYQSYIENRAFGEEEFPPIDHEVMHACQEKLQRIFSELRDNVSFKI